MEFQTIRANLYSHHAVSFIDLYFYLYDHYSEYLTKFLTSHCSESSKILWDLFTISQPTINDYHQSILLFGMSITLNSDYFPYIVH